MKFNKALVTAQEPEEEDVSEKVLEHLPHLAAEMGQSETEVKIDGVRWEETHRTRQTIKPGAPRFSGYSPDAVDFLGCTALDHYTRQSIIHVYGNYLLLQ